MGEIIAKVYLFSVIFVENERARLQREKMRRPAGPSCPIWHGASSRDAMSVEPIASKMAIRSDKLSGVVEADETYSAGNRRIGPTNKADREKLLTGCPTHDHKKETAVMALVERGGRVHCFPMERIMSDKVQDAIREHVERSSHMMTDEYEIHHGLDMIFAGHDSVTPSRKECVRGNVHTNTAEGFCSPLKCDINGVYHHLGKAARKKGPMVLGRPRG
jgi:hypothetical protein